MTPRFLIAALLMLPGPALAADRVATVTSFDRIRVDGPYRVEIVTGRGTSAKISGDRAAIDRVDIAVQGTLLTIRTNRTAWQGGWPDDEKGGPVIIRLTTGELRGAAISGSGSVMIDKVRGPRLSLAVEGSARMTIGRVETDRLDLGLAGSGNLTLAGATKALTAIVRGAATIDGAGLIANDLTVTSESAGNVTLGAKLSAKVVSSGAGGVAIGGKPACTVNALGSGEVVCG
ncbi:head GIN domain-containing protein [Sphingobium boeckii]|uniref:Putative auto-transporter adhesin head GIN domain-containing protein n=1 Tax=Sphingobium boeckii TaxID=1082345 RepID=A0A7W9AEJ4_9SPHN|nr:head GIN domain-containing protein [Sphingobium boeckii]MBB5684150.1 hypothetical protein [Sphingobium boeckii]